MKRINLKFNFISKDKIFCIYTKRIFDYAIPNRTTYVDCDSPSVIYLITFNRCFLQYVEETVQKLNESFNWHKTGFNKARKCGFFRMLSHDFYIVICKNATYLVQMLEK